MSIEQKTNFTTLKEAHEHLEKMGYQSIDHRFWFIPHTRKWAFLTEHSKKVSYFINVPRGGTLVAEVMPITSPRKNRKQKKDYVHG